MDLWEVLRTGSPGLPRVADPRLLLWHAPPCRERRARRSGSRSEIKNTARIFDLAKIAHLDVVEDQRRPVLGPASAVGCVQKLRQAMPDLDSNDEESEILRIMTIFTFQEVRPSRHLLLHCGTPKAAPWMTMTLHW
jgi:hypothetical protein